MYKNERSQDNEDGWFFFCFYIYFAGSTQEIVNRLIWKEKQKKRHDKPHTTSHGAKFLPQNQWKVLSTFS